MSPSFTLLKAVPWRRAASSAALAASLLFALQPSLLLAQVQMNDPDRVPPKTKSSAPAMKAVSRHTPTDNVSDDLNRRESQRVEELMRSMNAPAATPTAAALSVASKPVEKATGVAGPSEALPPTVAAIPPRAPIMRSSLTPDVDTGGLTASPSSPAPAPPAA